MNRPKILVLGAGYGGLTTVVNLQKQLGAEQAEITLINKNDYHYETTWLHEVGAGTISPEAARYPIASVINKDVKFVQAERDLALCTLYLCKLLMGAPAYVCTKDNNITFDSLMRAFKDFNITLNQMLT